MPQLIRYIDAIAREKQRGVLFVQFDPENYGVKVFKYDRDKDRVRTNFLKWLDKQGIGWEKCGPFVTNSYFLGYLGDIYLDIPYDEGNELY